MNNAVTKFACFCGYHSEGQGRAPVCKHCGSQMHSWGERKVTIRSNVLIGESADKRNWNGGYS